MSDDRHQRTSPAGRSYARRLVLHRRDVGVGEAAAFAERVEYLGYSTLWLPETTGRDPFAHIAFLATQTTTLRFATGIANVFHRHPGMMMQVTNTLAEQTAGRFLLGLGVSHAPIVAGLRKLDYSNPLTQMRTYLDGDGRLAVLGPQAEPPRPSGCSPRSARRCSSSPPSGPTAPTRTGRRRSTPPRHAGSSGPTSCCASSRRSS